ncbi:MAG TPA: MBL fold metallo-hydrolase [Marmoricola sp.]|nr:MBL fold metallo-hydrolase [Marmoricola sp.]
MAKTPVVQLAANLWRIPTAPASFVNSYVFVEDDGSVTLVDTGVKKAPPRIVAGLAAIGKHPKDVTRILLTHAHPDHAGGAAELARRTGAPVSLHDAEHPWAAAGEVLARPKETSLLGRLMMRVGKPTFEPFEPGPALHDGEVLPVAGGLRVVHTPGHSPGHVSLLHEPSGVLVTGDAIFNVRGLRFSPKSLCADFRMSTQTAQRLGELDYDVAAFTHGPEIRDNAREQVRGFLRAVE